MLRKTFAASVLVLTAGCVSQPGSVDARYVSPTLYQSWSCSQLAEESTRLQDAVAHTSGIQRENANTDAALAVGAVFLWPVLLGMAATKDHAEELGHLKGEANAVGESYTAHACTVAPPVATPQTPRA